jgi:uncharacterized protein (UPF0305 family)
MKNIKHYIDHLCQYCPEDKQAEFIANIMIDTISLVKDLVEESPYYSEKFKEALEIVDWYIDEELFK